VDKYQGQQNDYVLLSLVRTKLVGHFRDVRRLVVALSRARLGLYVFGRAELFANCYELRPAFARLMQRPTQVGRGAARRGAARRGGGEGEGGAGGPPCALSAARVRVALPPSSPSALSPRTTAAPPPLQPPNPSWPS
jgi:hypothetical protein